MTAIDKTGASEAEFRARIAPFEADVETVARAIHEARYIDYVTPDGDVSFTETDSRTLAAAAIAAMPVSPAEEAVKRVEALCDAQGDDSYVMTYALRAALTSPAPAPHDAGTGMGEGVQ